MPFQTDERLKSYLDTNQLHREQLCLAILATDKRFSDVRPRHPRGGRDGGRDIEALFRGNQVAYGAVGFVNQANDSGEQKVSIARKFRDDLSLAMKAQPKPGVFVFLTNVNLTVGEKDALVSEARAAGLTHSEVIDRERLRIALDSPDGFSSRFQYLGLALSEEEQASFFAKWGDDIQSVISTGFQRVEKTLDRLLFLQEASDVLDTLHIAFELKRTFDAVDVGHFRAFCMLQLKGPLHGILGVLFGSADKSGRMRTDVEWDHTTQPAGVKYGVSGGQWELRVAPGPEENADIDATTDDPDEGESPKYTSAGWSSSVGIDPVQFVTIQYRHDHVIRLRPRLRLLDINEAMFLPILTKSLAEKVKAIHIYANGYKLLQKSRNSFEIDPEPFDPSVPTPFSEEELRDPWVRVRPVDSSAFKFSFFDETPTRLFVPRQTQNSLAK